jgi:hypothetical protein
MSGNNKNLMVGFTGYYGGRIYFFNHQSYPADRSFVGFSRFSDVDIRAALPAMRGAFYERGIFRKRNNLTPLFIHYH